MPPARGPRRRASARGPRTCSPLRSRLMRPSVRPEKSAESEIRTATVIQAPQAGKDSVASLSQLAMHPGGHSPGSMPPARCSSTRRGAGEAQPQGRERQSELPEQPLANDTRNAWGARAPGGPRTRGRTTGRRRRAPYGRKRGPVHAVYGRCRGVCGSRSARSPGSPRPRLRSTRVQQKVRYVAATFRQMDVACSPRPRRALTRGNAAPSRRRSPKPAPLLPRRWCARRATPLDSVEHQADRPCARSARRSPPPASRSCSRPSSRPRLQLSAARPGGTAAGARAKAGARSPHALARQSAHEA